jgi:hypothetical protein
MTAAVNRSAMSSITRAPTSVRNSGNPVTCLYSDGVATPVRWATAANVSAPTPPSSTTASAASTTAAVERPALGMLATWHSLKANGIS